MIKAIDIAKYFLSKDKEHAVFDKTIIEKNNRRFYAGNARLNKYLHLAQNLYIAKTGHLLFEDPLYAYDNGAVVPEVQENYAILRSRDEKIDIPLDIKQFLDKVYAFLKNATLDELIDLSHEDDEWLQKHSFYDKKSQKMESLSHYEDYKEQYADALLVMERMHQ